MASKKTKKKKVSKKVAKRVTKKALPRKGEPAASAKPRRVKTTTV